MPSTIGSTASRWLGFAASVSRTSLPAGDACFPVVPRWYFTSPEPWALAGSSSPSNSRKICAYDLPITFVSTLRRPRCAMPSTTSDMPASAASLHSASSIGTSVSAPSRLKRFWPRYFVCRKRSSASAAFNRSRMRSLSAGLHRGGGRFDVLLDPLLLVGLLDVHVLDAHGARVGVAEDAEDLAQRHRGAARVAAEVADGEVAVEVPDREVVVGDVELGMRVRLSPPERVEVGDEVPADAVHVHERVDLHHLLVLGVRDRRTRCDQGSNEPARRAPRARANTSSKKPSVPSRRSWMRRRNSPLSAPVMMRWS